MQNNKLRILFDASIVVNLVIIGLSRTGVFFAAFNILKELLKRDDIEVEVYAIPENYYALRTVIENYPSLQSAKVADCYSPFANLLKKFDDLLYDSRKHKGWFVTRYIIKFFRAILRFLYKFFKPEILDKNKIAKNFNAFFTPIHPVPKCLRNQKSLVKFMLLHDVTPLIFPQYFKGAEKGKHFFFDIVNSINKDDYYFANSEYTKQDFIKYVPKIDGEKITTALLAADECFQKVDDENLINSARAKYNIPCDKKYLFSLCSLEPRKNLIRAVNAFIEFIEKHKIDDLVYVLGGGAWEGFIEKLEREVPNYNQYKDKIIRAGYVEDEDLPRLYSGAEFFVYTSQYEGFGLPPLEAMKCGMAVITSNNSSLPEVVGDAGITIDYDSVAQHIEAYEKLYFDKNVRENYKQKAIVQAQKFGWDKTAAIIADTMKKIVLG